jgi:hypothetical protein
VPAVEAKQRVVIGAQVFRWWPASDGVVEHSAHGQAGHGPRSVGSG